MAELFHVVARSSSSEADPLLTAALGLGTTPKGGIFDLGNKSLEIYTQVLLLSLFSKCSGFSCSSCPRLEQALTPHLLVGWQPLVSALVSELSL